MRPRLAVLYDTDGWSFHHIALQIKRYLSDEYEIFLSPYQKISPGGRAFLADCRAVICLWYGALAFVQQGRPEHAPQQERIVPPDCKLIACVFDEVLRWNDKGRARKALVHACETADMVLLACEGMEDRLFPELPTPGQIGYCKDGVDTELFAARRPRRDLHSTPLRVGWVGNSASDFFGRIKGLEQIKEACSRVPGVQFVYHDRAEQGLLPHNEMPRFYEGIDVQVCFSACEGTPNPILEAASVGRAFVSTAVGVVPEVIRDARALGHTTPPGVIVPREPELLSSALKALRDDRDLVAHMGDVGRETVREHWTWRKKIEQYREALRSLLA